MKIEQNFPLEHCEKCKKLELHTEVSSFYSFDEIVGRVIEIGCEHEQECASIYKMLKEKLHERSTTREKKN